jgi:hypothetical protein
VERSGVASHRTFTSQLFSSRQCTRRRRRTQIQQVIIVTLPEVHFARCAICPALRSWRCTCSWSRGTALVLHDPRRARACRSSVDREEDGMAEEDRDSLEASMEPAAAAVKERRRCRGWRRRTVGGRAGVAREHARSKVPRAPATAETRWSNERLHADSITRIVCLIFNHNPSSPFSVLSPFSCLRIPFLSRPLPVLENLDHSKSSAAISLCLLLDLGKKTALSGFCLMATPLF